VIAKPRFGQTRISCDQPTRFVGVEDLWYLGYNLLLLTILTLFCLGIFSKAF